MAENKNNGRDDSRRYREDRDDRDRHDNGRDHHHGHHGHQGVVLTGDSGPDRLKGTSRADVLDGGAGSDRIDGRPGNDLLIYNLSQNTGARDRYDGGAGSDTLRLVLTGAEWARADVKADVLRLLAFMDARDHSGADGEGSARWFSFEAFGLEVRRIEKLEVIVDGLAVDPRGSGGGVDARDDAVTVGEDGSVAGNVLANDDGQISSVSLVSGPAQGQLQLNADGSFTYVPGAGFDSLGTGEATLQSFTYRITDAQVNSDTATVNITIAGANDAPVFPTPDLLIAQAEGTHSIAWDLLDGAIDPDGDSVSLGAIGSLPPGVTLDGRYLSVDPSDPAYDGMAAGQSLTQSITYDVVDSNGGVTQRTVQITIFGTNDLPVAGPVLDITASEDGMPISIRLTDGAFDPDSGAVLQAVNLNYPWPGISLIDNVLTLDPGAADYQSLNPLQSYSFQLAYDIVDDQGGYSTEHGYVDVTVHGVNDSPIVYKDDLVVEQAEGSHSIAWDLLDGTTDIDNGDSLSVSLPAALPPGMTLAERFLHVDPAHPAYDYLAVGEALVVEVDYDVVDLFGGATRRTFTVTITGDNDVPVIQVLSSTLQATVKEDVITSAGGQLNVSDPDEDGAFSYSLFGGTATHSVDFRAAIGNFRVVKNGTVFFEDRFDNSNPPPTAPNLLGGISTSYGVTGGFTEFNGHAYMDAADGQIVYGASSTNPLVGQVAVLTTDATNSTTAGLKRNHDFTVTGRFDLTIPDDPRDAYGIRLSDRLSSKPGDDVIDLVVRRAPDGVVRVLLVELDYVAGQFNTAAGIELVVPAEADQIQLNLSHLASNPGALTASFDLYAGTRYLSSQALGSSVSTRIFGMETTDTADDEVWTRAGFVAYGSQSSNAFMIGSYGTLSLTANGAWTYNLSNSRANVQSLAEGEIVNDDFTVQVVDESGASDTATVSIRVEGTNDAPYDIVGHLQCMIAETTPAGTSLGHLEGLDIDHGARVTLSLVNSAGGRFALRNDEVVLLADLSQEPNYGPFTITVRATDEHGSFREESFSFGRADMNQAPTNIEYINYHSMQPAHPENMEPGSIVGSLWTVDPDAQDMFFTYSLVDDADGRFRIQDNLLLANGSFDFESQSAIQVVVRASDSSGLYVDKALTVALSNISEEPLLFSAPVKGAVDFWLLSSSTRENTPAGTYASGILVAEPDLYDSGALWTLTLLNEADVPFYIQRDELFTKGVLDFETRQSYVLNIQAISTSGYSLTKELTINVLDLQGEEYLAPPSGGVHHGWLEADNFAGGPGRDLLDGFGGDDLLTGAMGNDILRGGTGNDVLDGGSWFDANLFFTFDDIDYASYSTAINSVGVNLGDGIGLEYGSTDSLDHMEGVIGSDYDDVLAGGSPSTMEFFRGGAGSDEIFGMGGIDRAEYRDASGGINVYLAAGSVSGAGGDLDTLRDIEEIEGSSFADRFDATGFGLGAVNHGSSGTTINGFLPGGGNDTIIGNGNTRLDYSNAEDCVEVDLTNGVVHGSYAIGTDIFSGVSRLRGSAWGDDFYGGTNAPLEYFEGMGGNDYIDGREGYDIAGYSFDGNIAQGIRVDLGLGIVTGDLLYTGIDTLRSIESVDGSVLADVFDASRFSNLSPNAGSLLRFNEFQGRAGNDTLIGNGYTRASYADAMAAVTVDLVAGTGNGDGSVGTDQFLGGVSSIAGSFFNDVLRGDAGANYIEGRVGNDTIDGRGGEDNLTGGVGSDTFIGYAGSNFDFITDFQTGTGPEHDVLDLRGLGVSSGAEGLNVENLLGGAAIWYFPNGGAQTWAIQDMSPVVVLLGMQASPNLLDNLVAQGNLLI